jgi:hypothetical protein
MTVNTHYTVANVPAGLTAVVTGTSTTTATVTLTGTAAAHASANNISNLTLTFLDAAFTGGTASVVTNYTKSNLLINYTDPAPTVAITYSVAGPYKSGTAVTIIATFSEAVKDSPVAKIEISGNDTVGATEMTKFTATEYRYSYTAGAGNGLATISITIAENIAGVVVISTPTTGATFTLDNTGPAAPTVNIGSGTYTVQQNVTVTPPGDAADTYYTLDGSEPDNTSSSLAGPIAIDGADTVVVILKAVSYDASGNKGAILTQAYTFDKSGPVLITPPAPTHTINFITEQTGEIVPATEEYSTDSNFTTNVVSGSAVEISLTPGTNIYFRVKAVPGVSTVSPIQTLIVPARPSRPSHTMNYTTYTTVDTIPVTEEYNTNGDFAASSTDGAGVAVAVPHGQTLYIRVKAVAGVSFASDVQILRKRIATSRPRVYGVEDGGVYNKNVAITFENAICFLNGERINNGTTIEEERSHRLELVNSEGNTVLTYNFTIDKTAPIVEGVMDGYSYNYDVKITFNEGIATLNGSKITSDYELSKEGNYVLVVTDIAGNATKINFSIDKTVPVITGVEDGKEYNMPVVVTFNEGAGKINDADFISGKTINSNGEYFIKVTDWAGNSTTVKFTYRDYSLEEILNLIQKEPANYSYYLIYKNVINKRGDFKNIKLFVDGQPVDFRDYDNVAPTVINGKLAVPYKAAADYLGARFYLDNKTKEYVSQDDYRKIILKNNSISAKVNDIIKNMDTPSVEINGKLFTSFKFVTETFLRKSYWISGDSSHSSDVGIAVMFKDANFTEINKPIEVIDDQIPNNPNKPIITGAENNGLYNKPVYIEIKSGNYILDGSNNSEGISKYLFATLDGRNFLGGVVLTEGQHKIIAKTDKGIKSEITFKIDRTPPNIYGVEKGKTYDSPLAISFDDGTAFLNGVPYVKNTIINKKGHYEIFVMDDAGNSSSVEFDLKINQIQSGDIENVDTLYFNKYIQLETSKQIKVIYVNDNEMSGNIILSEEGTYKVRVIYENGKEKTGEIVIDKTSPIISGVEDYRKYNKQVKLEFNEGTGTINGEEFQSGTLIEEEGDYEIRVIDKSGNLSKMLFTIDKTPPEINGVVESVVYTDFVKVYYNEGIGRINNRFIRNGEEVTEVGEYRVEVRDSAGNVSWVNFIIREMTIEELFEKIKEYPDKLTYYSRIASKMEEKKYDRINIFAGGELVDFAKYSDVKPIIVENRVLVPIRAITDILAAKVDWNDEDKLLSIIIGQETIRMKVNSKIVYRENEKYEIDVPVKLVNGRVLVPVRFINEVMGKEVYWYDHGKNLKIIAIY